MIELHLGGCKQNNQHRRFQMNYTQNEKIEQVTDTTMVVGVDIGSQTHYARAFDNRGRELTKRVFSFQNDIEGFNFFNLWAETLKKANGKTDVLIGCEPTGHYWFAFAKYVKDHRKTLVMVNPFSVKKIKELDDNSPKKTDSKDPKTIRKRSQNWWWMDDIRFHTCQKAFMPK